MTTLIAAVVSTLTVAIAAFVATAALELEPEPVKDSDHRSPLRP